jgi:hypothetical protein
MITSTDMARVGRKRTAGGGWITIWYLYLIVATCCAGQAEDFATLCADRMAVERVYYNHRLGDKQPFEQVLPQALIEQIAKEDVRKETALRKLYGVEVTAAMIEAEVKRINTTTRAPEMLAEIKAALRNDSVKFATVFAKPILVERLLREKFENDDTVHSPQRRRIETVREVLLAARGNGVVVTNLVSLLKHHDSDDLSKTTWQLGSRPDKPRGANVRDEVELKRRFGPNAQVISCSQAEMDQKPYFEDLPVNLQRVLRTQLRQAGDFSSVVEMPRGFALYLATERTESVLSVIYLFLPKRSYEAWLAEQKQ